MEKTYKSRSYKRAKTPQQRKFKRAIKAVGKHSWRPMAEADAWHVFDELTRQQQRMLLLLMMFGMYSMAARMLYTERDRLLDEYEAFLRETEEEPDTEDLDEMTKTEIEFEGILSTYGIADPDDLATLGHYLSKAYNIGRRDGYEDGFWQFDNVNL